MNDEYKAAIKNILTQAKKIEERFPMVSTDTCLNLACQVWSSTRFAPARAQREVVTDVTLHTDASGDSYRLEVTKDLL